MQFNYSRFINDIWFERRDIVSDGYDKALTYIHKLLPNMSIRRYASNSEAWTWIIPEKWTLRKAQIKSNGKIILDSRDHPLHVMSYSAPVSGKVTKKELLAHLHSRPECPEVIPFEFSYYKKDWGFCVQHNKMREFTSNEYEVLIDSEFSPGELKVGELCVPGVIKDEIVIMAHLCHPCMVDDGLSGVSVLTSIAKQVMAMPGYYSYRFLIVPETIGSIAYLSHNEHLLKTMKYGIFLEMLGHDGSFSLQSSKQGTTLIDKAAEVCFKEMDLEYKIGKFLEVICNDEKVLNGPGINIPTISISRSNFWGRGEWPYPQYHSSADTPEIISVKRLRESEVLVIKILDILNQNYYPLATVKGPIFLSRYGLWVDWRKNRELNTKQAEVLYYLHDGKKSLVDIAYELGLPFKILKEWLDIFLKNGLIKKINPEKV